MSDPITTSACPPGYSFVDFTCVRDDAALVLFFAVLVIGVIAWIWRESSKP